MLNYLYKEIFHLYIYIYIIYTYIHMYLYKLSNVRLQTGKAKFEYYN